MDTTAPTLQRLDDDRRGFILIVACVMGALLVGALWYVASVGDAIVFRERMQDAADATAFEDAVWHARGMNAVAMLNIVMALVLAVLVALRVVELLCAAYLALTVIVCVAAGFFPIFGVACAPLKAFAGTVQSALDRVVNLDNKIAPKIMEVLLTLNKAEEVVAAAAPILATVESSANNSIFYQSPIDATVGLSLSLVPPALDNKIQGGDDPVEDTGAGGNQFPVRMGTLTPGKTGDIGERPSGTDSLPVAEDGFYRLCQHAGAFIPNQLGQLAARAGASELASGINLFADVLGDVAGSIPSLACTPWNKTALEGRLDQAVKTRCAQEKADYIKAHSDDGGAVSPPYTDKMAHNCTQKNKGKLEDNVPSTSTCKPAKVWDISKNGSVFMQTWSVAIAGGPPMQDHDDKGLIVADHGSRTHLVESASTGTLLDADTTNVGFAEAEYYFDCPGSWSGHWSIPFSQGYNVDGSCKDNAMWRLGWTARMRRVWSPLDELSLEDIASSWLTNAMYKGVNNQIKFATSGISNSTQKLLAKNLWDTWLTQELFKKNFSYGIKQIPGASSLDSTGYWLMQHLNGGQRRTIIH
jgi:hypothetical protein